MNAQKPFHCLLCREFSTQPLDCLTQLATDFLCRLLYQMINKRTDIFRVSRFCQQSLCMWESVLPAVVYVAECDSMWESVLQLHTFSLHRDWTHSPSSSYTEIAGWHPSLPQIPQPLSDYQNVTMECSDEFLMNQRFLPASQGLHSR